MRKIWALLLAIVLVACAPLRAAYVPAPDAPDATPFTLRLYMNGSQICTAVLVGPRSVYTAAHCIRESADYAVSRDSGMVFVRVQDVTQVGDRDLVEVELAAPLPGPYARLGAAQHRGDKAWIAGYGCESPHLAQRLLVLEHQAAPPYEDEIEYKGRACHGDSGSGVYDVEGGLVGITSAIRSYNGEALSVLVVGL